MRNQLDFYLFRLSFTPTAISLLIAALLLLLEQMLRLLDFVLNQNGPVDIIWRMLAYLLPHYLTLALPLSAFLGIVLAVRRLSLTSEYDAMLSSGLSPWRLLPALSFLAGLMMIANFILLAYIQPHARYQFDELRYELRAGLLGARIPVGKFVTVADGVRLRIGRTENTGADLYDIFVNYQSKDQKTHSSFTANHGQFVKAGDKNALILRLYDGRQLIKRVHQSTPSVLSFAEQDLVLDLPDIEAFRDRGLEKDEATLDELLYILGHDDDQTSQTYRESAASFHFRLIHSLTFLALPFLGMGLGLVNKRRPSQIGPIFGLACLILYHELLEEWAVHQVASGQLPPSLAFWPLFLLFMGLSVHHFYRTSERPGLPQIDSAWLLAFLTENWRRFIARKIES